jgi:prepilin-type N-terminal cleavage/methylation domain-containing protein
MKRIMLQSGFTLVELSIVLALTGLALSVFLAGQGTQRQQTQFTVDMDTLVNQIKGVQNEASNGVSYTGDTNTQSAVTGSSNFTYYGRQIEFWNTGVKVWTLVEPGCPANADRAAYTNGLCQVNEDYINYGSSLEFIGTVSTPLGGACSLPLVDFVRASNGQPAAISTPMCSDYNSSSPVLVSNVVQYEFEDVTDSARTAIVTVDPNANTVSVSFP